MWWVYVIQSEVPRRSKQGATLPGVYYVGVTTNPPRRLRQHNGEIKGGGKYTSKHRPWTPRAVFGPYPDRSTGMKAERALKKGKRAAGRVSWSPEDSKWCRGPGPNHPWINNPKYVFED